MVRLVGVACDPEPAVLQSWLLVIIGFMLGVSAVGLVHLLIAVFQRVEKDQPFCRRCGFNRTGIAAEADCPECGAAGEKKNVMMGHRIANKRRVRIAGVLIVAGLLVPAALLYAKSYADGLPLRFHHAVLNDDEQEIQAITGWFPELADGQFRFADYNHPPPLEMALTHGKAKSFDALLAAGADPDIPDTNGYSLLTAAIEANDLTLVERLLAAGADPDAPAEVDWNHQQSTAQFRYSPSSTRINLSAAPVPIPAVPTAPQSVLSLAIVDYNEAAAKRLLEAGADPNLSRGGCTPLCAAIVSRREVTFIEFLIGAGADVHATYNLFNLKDCSPMFMAVLVDNRAAINQLISAGADINAVAEFNGRQVTPLDFSRIIHGEYGAISELLMLRGGRFSELNEEDPLDTIRDYPDPLMNKDAVLRKLKLDAEMDRRLRDIEHAQRRLDRAYESRDQRVEELFLLHGFDGKTDNEPTATKDQSDPSSNPAP